jgi:MFS superfamily sulfate permease-like transporter
VTRSAATARFGVTPAAAAVFVLLLTCVTMLFLGPLVQRLTSHL